MPTTFRAGKHLYLLTITINVFHILEYNNEAHEHINILQLWAFTILIIKIIVEIST